MPKGAGYLGSIVSRAGKPAIGARIVRRVQPAIAPPPVLPRSSTVAAPSPDATAPASTVITVGPPAAHLPLPKNDPVPRSEAPRVTLNPLPPVREKGVRSTMPEILWTVEARAETAPWKRTHQPFPEISVVNAPFIHETTRKVVAARDPKEEIVAGSSIPSAAEAPSQVTVPPPVAVAPPSRVERTRLSVRFPEKLPVEVQAHRQTLERETVAQVRKQLRQQAETGRAAPLSAVAEIRVENIEVKIVQPPVAPHPGPAPIKSSSSGGQGFSSYFLQRTISSF